MQFKLPVMSRRRSQDNSRASLGEIQVVASLDLPFLLQEYQNG